MLRLRLEASPRQQLKRPRSMGQSERVVGWQPVFLARSHFPKGSSISIGNKDRVVAKTRRPARRKGQFAVYPSLERLDMAVRPGERQRAEEIGPARLLRPACLQFPLDALHSRGKIAQPARPARGIDSR